MINSMTLEIDFKWPASGDVKCLMNLLSIYCQNRHILIDEKRAKSIAVLVNALMEGARELTTKLYFDRSSPDGDRRSIIEVSIFDDNNGLQLKVAFDQYAPMPINDFESHWQKLALISQMTTSYNPRWDTWGNDFSVRMKI